MQTEFIRSLNCNYERILLDVKPEENKYQYCMLNRGGIKGLLSCSLRYINGVGYLYYDISSKQNIRQRYSSKCISREWIKDFLWSLGQIRKELERFLLDTENILWFPEQIYQEIENNIFSFLYVPYYTGENGFKELIEYWIDRIDYEDETLVEFIYHIYEKYENTGDIYLQSQIFEDAKILDDAPDLYVENVNNKEVDEASDKSEELSKVISFEPEKAEGSKRFFGLFEGRKKKNKETRESYKKEVQEAMQEYAVAEDSTYEEGYGKTIYIDTKATSDEHVLSFANGATLKVLDMDETTIGKKKGEVDVVIDDASVSRMHARITKERDVYYIEDLNSTNGTYKNGLQLQPYERRLLTEGDEIRVGRVLLRFD